MSDSHLFPIDIHYNKLLDWLIDRRHCDTKWHNQCKLVQERVAAAVKELPSSEQLAWVHEIDLLSYFDCVHLFDCLKSLEGDATTLFGQYSVPRVKEWWDILKGFEKNNLYLAESAQRMARMVNYEIPALKHQVNRLKQTQRECTRKESDLIANSAVFRDKFSAACKDFGIAGKNVQEELAQLVTELPSIFNKVLNDLSPLIPVITYYHSFIQYTTNKPCENNFLPMLSYVLKYGNVTVYEWKHGNPPPTSNTSITAVAQSASVVAESADIDWGNEIDFEEPEIDFGDSTDVDLSCITLEDSGDVGVASSEAISQNAEAIIDADELDSLLGSTATRALFLNDLLEVREFLSRRLHELSYETTTIFGLSQFESDSIVLERQSKEGVAEMLGHVTKVVDHLTSQRIQHLFLIKGSHRYLERTCESLLQNQRLSNKAVGQARELAARREGALVQVGKLEPKLTAMIEKTKQLQAQIASDISRRYQNRVVNIMGEINQL